MSEIDVQVQDVPERHRYQATTADGTVAAFVTYRRDDHRIVLVHTQTEDAFEGQGVAGELVRGALTDARARGLHVVPECPYVKAWLGRHPEFADVV